jgi:predicted aspartyl protease
MQPDGKHGAISRRLIIGGGLASLATISAQVRAQAADEAAIATGVSGRNLLTIPVEIDGRGPFHFVIDTGADCSVIADTVAEGLNLPRAAPVRVEGVVRTVEAQSVHIARLAAGSVSREALEWPVLPRNQLQADGYLGLDVIDGYRVSMDFQNRELRLLDPHPATALGWDAPREVAVRVSGSNGHLRSSNCVADGVRTTVFIDTGAEISVGNPALYAALIERDTDHVLHETVPLTGVTGGIVEGRVTLLRHVTLGGLSIDDSRIAIADLQVFNLWGLDDRPAMLIGMNWLSRFDRISVDYGRKQLRFDLASHIRREAPLRCPGGDPNCHYLLGSPITMPRPSVAT